MQLLGCRLVHDALHIALHLRAPSASAARCGRRSSAGKAHAPFCRARKASAAAPPTWPSPPPTHHPTWSGSWPGCTPARRYNATSARVAMQRERGINPSTRRKRRPGRHVTQLYRTPRSAGTQRRGLAAQPASAVRQRQQALRRARDRNGPLCEPCAVRSARRCRPRGAGAHQAVGAAARHRRRRHKGLETHGSGCAAAQSAAPRCLRLLAAPRRVARRARAGGPTRGCGARPAGGLGASASARRAPHFSTRRPVPSARRRGGGAPCRRRWLRSGCAPSTSTGARPGCNPGLHGLGRLAASAPLSQPAPHREGAAAARLLVAPSCARAMRVLSRVCGPRLNPCRSVFAPRRQSLRTVLSWCVHRSLFYEEVRPPPPLPCRAPACASLHVLAPCPLRRAAFEA